MSTTIITAYYTINSKYPSTLYKQWINNFLKLDANIVIFTDSKNFDWFQTLTSSLKNILIIKLDIIDFVVYKYIDYWNYCYSIDCEKKYVGHSPELYMLWNEKTFFCKKTIELNPFNSSYFFWFDIGSIRDSNILKLLNTINYPYYIPTSKFVLSMVDETFSKNSEFLENGILKNIYHIKNISDIKNCIQGGFFGGSIESWSIWISLFIKELDLFIQTKTFGGKDQYIMTNICIKNYDSFYIYKPLSINIDSINIDVWFSFIYRLSHNNIIL